MYGYVGLCCWLLILPLKAARHLGLGIDPMVVGVAPSLVGPAGLLLVILAGERRFARLTIARATLLAGGVALGLEFAQMLPWVREIYTFDWLDVAGTLLSLCAGALVAVGLARRHQRARR